LVVSTDFLAEAYRTFIADIRVVPNRMEQGPWLTLRNLRRTTRKPRIGWAGGSSHHSDLVLLKTVIEQTRDEADWIFFGMSPPEIRPLLAEYHKIVSFPDYPAYLASLNLDLAVAPLAQTAFNRGKSNLRLLDYGILGIPVVCTDIDPYRNSPACRVNNTVAEWTEAIRARIHDPDAREREGDSMRRWVLDGYLLENHLAEWLDAHLPG
jgi:glycosyltransferase involved in cell wall biosynthesis